MKNFKFIFLTLLLGLLFVTSCENEEGIIEDPQNVTQQSDAIVTALDRMSENFDQSGNIESNNSAAGNLIFDFCFDFVYPLTLSYNNDSTVTVDDLNDLIDVIVNATEDLYITGIAFPFDVEVYDDTTDSIIIQSINNEAEFLSLISTCDFSNDDCVCPNMYDPVCVEITDLNGEVFQITYENECHALCDGFNENDFIEDCYDNNYYDDFMCFNFVYPLDIILEDGSVVTITDDEDFENTTYNNFFYDFVYPFTVELDEDGSFVNITNEEEFLNLIEGCFSDPGDGCEQCEQEPYDPVCVQYIDNEGNTVIESYPNVCFALCYGFTQADFLDDCFVLDFTIYIGQSGCFGFNYPLNLLLEGGSTLSVNTFEDLLDGVYNQNAVTFIYPFSVTLVEDNSIITINNQMELETLSDDCNSTPVCSEQDIIDKLIECNIWTADVSGSIYTYTFGVNDGTVIVTDLSGNVITTGFWSFSTDSDGVTLLDINTSSGNFSVGWYFLNCGGPFPLSVVANQPWITNIASDCG
jgi:hypothetical protein